MKALLQLKQHGQISTDVENHSRFFLIASENYFYLFSFTKHVLSYILISFSISSPFLYITFVTFSFYLANIANRCIDVIQEVRKNTDSSKLYHGLLVLGWNLFLEIKCVSVLKENLKSRRRKKETFIYIYWYSREVLFNL